MFKNGCICCSTESRGGIEIEGVLDKLIYFSEKQRNFDYVILETTGLPDLQIFRELYCFRFLAYILGENLIQLDDHIGNPEFADVKGRMIIIEALNLL